MPLNVMEMMNQMLKQAQQPVGNLALLTDWNSFKCSLSAVSDQQDVILNEI